MKKWISIIALLWLCMAGYAAEVYLVNTKTLNMRAKPKAVLRSLDHCDRVRLSRWILLSMVGPLA